MAAYCIEFQTMQKYCSIQSTDTMETLLAVVSSAQEFESIVLVRKIPLFIFWRILMSTWLKRRNEKKALNEFHQFESFRFPFFKSKDLSNVQSLNVALTITQMKREQRETTSKHVNRR